MIEEVGVVRRELGYPIMVTPLSQYVVTQATLNITLGERYKEVLDEVIKIVLGCYGPSSRHGRPEHPGQGEEPPGSEKLHRLGDPPPVHKELREQFGADVSDDELVLRVLCQDQKAMEAMHAAGHIKTYYPPLRKPLIELVKELINHKKHAYIYMENDDFSIRLTRGSS